MSVEYFIDTNVLIYDFDNDTPRKQEIARKLVKQALRDDSEAISYQVVQESLNVLTKMAARPLSGTHAERYLTEVLEPLCQVYSSFALYRQALSVKARWRYCFCDSLILAAAMSAGCQTLYTEDMQHGQIVDSITVVNPFYSE